MKEKRKKIELKSNTIFFRLAEVADAKFILSLRVDDKYNKYLSAVDNDLEEQREWLANYKEKEKNGTEYYFIICRNLDNKPIGTVRMYDFLKERNSFCWGSWILNEDKTKYAALETAVLIYEYAFFELCFTNCHFDVRKGNEGVVNFHKRFGAIFNGETELDVLGNLSKDDYLKVRENHKKFLDENAMIGVGTMITKNIPVNEIQASNPNKMLNKVKSTPPPINIY
jgi:RimJ/RimL family protein N-acetyltransferase